MQSAQLAGRTQLLHPSRAPGMEPRLAQHPWVSDCCSLGQLLPQGLQPSTKRSPWRQLEPIMTLFWKLILSEAISSFPSPHAKQTDQDTAEKLSLNFQLIFHTHSLPPPPAILFSLHQGPQ